LYESNKRGKSPALPGDSQSLTVPGCNKVLRVKAVQFRVKRTGCHVVIPAGLEPESMVFIFSKAKGLDPGLKHAGVTCVNV
jgi:hypothetical protein